MALDVWYIAWHVGVPWLLGRDCSNRTTSFQLARGLLIGIHQPSLFIMRGWSLLQPTILFWLVDILLAYHLCILPGTICSYSGLAEYYIIAHYFPAYFIFAAVVIHCLPISGKIQTKTKDTTFLQLLSLSERSFNKQEEFILKQIIKNYSLSA